MAEASAPGTAPSRRRRLGATGDRGRRRAGRTTMVVAGAGYLETVDTLAVMVPITTVDRGWPNHVEVIGADLGRRPWAMTEQVRTISRERLVGRVGRVGPGDPRCRPHMDADFLEL